MASGYVIIVHPNSTVTVEDTLDGEPRLGQLQKAVNGYIETPPGFGRLFAHSEFVAQLPSEVLRLFNGERSIPCIAYCDEDGKAKGAPANPLATQLWAYSLVANKTVNMEPTGEVWMEDILVGPVAILVGERAIAEEHEA